MPDEFLTVQEVSDHLKVNPQTVYIWLDRGEIPSVRVGKRRRRIHQSALDAFLEAGSQPPVGSEPAEEVDEGSVTAWATFGAAMAETTAVLEGTDQAELVRALDALSEAARTLADRLR
jgi:excisionase family DNA binding protein